jgi:double-strand break repair protein MRE11
MSNIGDTIRFLVITDNHVGFNETDPIRFTDAMAGFEEAMQIAASLNVDFILHGGDLFHEARPSREAMYGAMKLIKKYTENHRPSTNFQTNFSTKTPSDQLPIFMIHGNHDEPTGERNLAAADILEAAGLVNYFGRQNEVDGELKVSPILMKKGSTKLALYGLGNIKDERLHRSFLQGKVVFEFPGQEWFNLMTIHQNRFRGNANGAPSKSCIHETFLPSFLDLTVWGHEHESKPEPQEFLEAYNPGVRLLRL